MGTEWAKKNILQPENIRKVLLLMAEILHQLRLVVYPVIYIYL